MTLRDVVRAHMHDTITYVYASGGAAKEIQDDLVRKAFPVRKGAGRVTKAVDAATLKRINLPPSWLLVVLVADESDVAVIATWARGKDASRVRLYFPPGTDLVAGAKPWDSQKLTPAVASHFREVPGFRHEVGIAINDRIGKDFS